MEILEATTLGDIYRIINSPFEEKLVRDGINDGDVENWEMTTPKQLVGDNLRLIAAAERVSQEAEEGVQAVRDFVSDSSEENRRRVLEEIADQREFQCAILETLGLTEEDLALEIERKRGKVGGVSQYIFMSSRKRRL